MPSPMLVGLLLVAVVGVPGPDLTRVWASVQPGGQGPVVKATYGDSYYRFSVLHQMWPLGDRLQLKVDENPPAWTLPPGIRIRHKWVMTEDTVSGPWDGVGTHLVLDGKGIGPGPDDGPRRYTVRYEMTFHPETGRITGTRVMNGRFTTTFEIAPVLPAPAARSRERPGE